MNSVASSIAFVVFLDEEKGQLGGKRATVASIVKSRALKYSMVEAWDDNQIA
jgi:hypothetical protein